MTYPILLILGIIILTGFYLGRNMRYIKLPSIIGYMLLGVVMGSSVLNVLDHQLIDNLDFISSIALGFVAFSIGLELKFTHLKKLGKGIIYIIFMESFGAFILVFISLQLFTGDTPLSLLFAAIAPASAPAGTVAVIREYQAKGVLTKALYAVVGFDDGLGIIIFGFASAFAQGMLSKEAGNIDAGIMATLLRPLLEIGLSVICGGAIAFICVLLIRKLKVSSEVFILIFGFIFVSCGICEMLHLSIILTIMVIGMVIVNTQGSNIVAKIQNELGQAMPLLFILFFTLAGANLHIATLPALGLLGIIYVLARSAGLIFGSRLGAVMGHVQPVIKKYVGLGILSQAGVAIGLSLLVKHDFAGLGKIVDTTTKSAHGDIIGITVITTVTATCIVFEIIGPILTRIALEKAGEIKPANQQQNN
ncbi:MAG: cation:proton antiporter [Candidatus Cloacimonetes bacterium]|nr:cation:proton antiporter [Candidatus Cloacimonadota bacterium]